MGDDILKVLLCQVFCGKMVYPFVLEYLCQSLKSPYQKANVDVLLSVILPRSAPLHVLKRRGVLERRQPQRKQKSPSHKRSDPRAPSRRQGKRFVHPKRADQARKERTLYRLVRRLYLCFLDSFAVLFVWAP